MKSKYGLTKEQQIQRILNDCKKHCYEWSKEFLESQTIIELDERIDHIDFCNEYF